MYVSANDRLNVRKRQFNWSQPLWKTIDLGCRIKRIKSNRKKLAVICGSRMMLIDIDSLDKEKLRIVEVCSKCKEIRLTCLKEFS